MPMDIELQGVYDDTKRITVLIPHWETVLKAQGQWEPVEKKEQPLLIPQEEVPLIGSLTDEDIGVLAKKLADTIDDEILEKALSSVEKEQPLLISQEEEKVVAGGEVDFSVLKEAAPKKKRGRKKKDA